MHVRLKGINKVRTRLVSGEVVETHYAFRGKGAPAFWRSDSGIKKGSPEYIAALAACAEPPPSKGKFREILLAFLKSQDFLTLAPRTQSDMRKSINHPVNGIDAEFGSAPAGVFNAPGIRGEVLEWRDRIGGKVGDDRMRHLQRIVGWARDRNKLSANHLTDLKSVYTANRAEVFWTEDEIALFIAKTPKHVGRILTAATETGLRPGDLLRLGPEHVFPTIWGRRIVIRTAKRNRLASIPVTPRMSALIDETPKGAERFITNKAGQPYQHENYLGDAVSQWRDKLGMRAVRLYDARGTAATRLLMADASAKEIATAMGWSVQQAMKMIETYAALSPEMSDGLLKKLRESR